MIPHQANPRLSQSEYQPPEAVQIPRHLLLAAARRIVSQNSDSEVAARRLIANATDNGIDLALLFGVLGGRTLAGGSSVADTIRQVCLFVKGAGRTSIVFLSEPPRDGEIGTFEVATKDRSACLKLGCGVVKKHFGDDVQVAQALPDPRETWATAAFADAGFSKVGELQYLRRAWRSSAGLDKTQVSEIGLDILRLSDIPEPEHHGVLLAALEASYTDTLDCPELCGLRTTQDILESHLATGQFVPELWWVLKVGGVPRGCMLFSPIPGQRTVELVYLGIAPELRGKGLSTKLLSMGISQVRSHAMLQFGFEEFTCAVDLRNLPARRVYERAGFQSFAERVAFVKTL